MLWGPREGQGATKKLLAIGSVKVKLPSPPRHQEKPACGCAGTARARIASLKARSHRPAINTPTVLTFKSIWLGVVWDSAARAAPATADRAAACSLPRRCARCAKSRLPARQTPAAALTNAPHTGANIPNAPQPAPMQLHAASSPLAAALRDR